MGYLSIIPSFLKELDIVEILKGGSIGLGFLLALMSFLLISKEQKKKKVEQNKLFLNSAKLFMVFSIVIMTLGLLSELIKTNKVFAMSIGNEKAVVNELSSKPLSSINPQDYFINSTHGFAIRKPKKGWSEIKEVKGPNLLIEIMEIKSSVITEELFERVAENPETKFLAEATHFSPQNIDSRSNVVVTDSTGNDLIDKHIAEKAKLLLDTSAVLTFWDDSYDTTDAEEKKEYLEEVVDYRRDLIMFDSVISKISILISAYQKTSFSYYKKINLPSFYTLYSSALGINTDKLQATEEQILVGAEIILENVLVNGKNSKYQSKKWVMITESDDYFFTVEINYSPQLSGDIDLWDELQEYLNSFVLIE